MTDRERFLEFCREQLEKPYVFGSTGPNSFDCSGLIFAGLIALTTDPIPRLSTDQFTMGAKIEMSEVKPGDLVFFDTGWTNRVPNHLGVCIGNGRMINANRYYNRVVEESFVTSYWQPRITGFKRIFNQNDRCDVLPKESAEPLAFSDVKPDHAHAEFIDKLHERGIVQGFPGNLFKPDQPVTRAEALKIILMAFETAIKDAPQSSFSDIHPTDWHIGIVETAKKLGIVNGYGDGSFKPNNPVNRAEITKIICKTGNTPTLPPTQNPFTDVEKTTWFAPFAATAKTREMFLASDNRWQPAARVTRGEMCRAIEMFLAHDGE
jgi:hypothetical protein